MVSSKKINLDLGNMLSLLQVLENPETKLKNVIHVAGTNGKGSTCAFLSAILQAMGYSVNLYTSPHLVKFNERIKIYGADINDSQLIEYEERCKDLWGNKDYTFFEIATAMAFLAFNDHRADFNILEVGLGGTLDATNVVKNVILSIVTSISMDHIEILGPNIESIASNKAGIIKHSTPVLLSQQKYHEAVKTIEVRAEAMQARLYQANRDWHIRPNRDKTFTYQDAFGWQLYNLKPPLAGSHQYDNLSTAIFATHILEINGKIKTTQTIKNGTLSSTKWSARIQRIQIPELQNKVREVILDGSHNEDSICALCSYLKEHTNDKPIGIFGCLSNKDLNGMIPHMQQVFSFIYCIATEGDFPSSFADAHDIAEKLKGYDIKATAVDPSKNTTALQAALISIANDTQKHNKTLVIFGSLYLAGQVLEQYN